MINESFDPPGTTQPLELRQGWSTNAFQLLIVTVCILGSIFVLSQAYGERKFFAVAFLGAVITQAVCLIGYLIISSHTRKLEATLFANGISNRAGKFSAWQELDEIRYVFGSLWFRKRGSILPEFSLTERSLGAKQIETAAHYVRANAPERLTQKL